MFKDFLCGTLYRLRAEKGMLSPHMSGFAEGMWLFVVLLMFCAPVVLLIAAGTYWEKKRLNRFFWLFAEAHGWTFVSDLSLIGTVHPSATGSVGKDHTAVLLLASGGVYTAPVASGVVGIYATVYTTLTVRGPRVGALTEEALRERSGVQQLAVRLEPGVACLVFPFAMAGKRKREVVERVLTVITEVLG